MKKTLVVIIAVLFSLAAKSQTVTDTASYIATIRDSKANYIGKPFSTLLNSLKIKFVAFGPFANDFDNKNKETSTRFYFSNPATLDQIKRNYIEILWNPYLDHNATLVIFNQGPLGGQFSLNASNYYKNGIIKDIIVSPNVPQ